MIAIINCGTGNLLSVSKAFEYIAPDKKTIVIDSPKQLTSATHIVLPGAGNYNTAMENLRQMGFIPALEQEVRVQKKPFLGICLGMQLLTEYGLEQKRTNGLGWIKGHVRKINANNLVLPHIGWQQIEPTNDHCLLNGTKGKDFYFVHNYIVDCSKDDIIATCTYGETFPVAIACDNIFAVQFHPEKSRQAGLTILRNFIGDDACSNIESFLSYC